MKMKHLFLGLFVFCTTYFFGQNQSYSFCGVSSANEAALNNIGQIAKADSNIVSLKYLAKQKLLIAEVKNNPARKREFDLFSWMQKNDIELFIYRKAVKQEFLSELLANSEMKSLK
jgi:hypothetical protein